MAHELRNAVKLVLVLLHLVDFGPIWSQKQLFRLNVFVFEVVLVYLHQGSLSVHLDTLQKQVILRSSLFVIRIINDAQVEMLH